MKERILIAEEISKTYLKDDRTQSFWASAALGKLFGQNKPAPTTNTFEALHNISFTLPECSVLGIIGRNGAGKSTLLQVLSGIVAPTKGNVWYNGRIAAVLDVGTGFHPDLSGRENIYFSGALWGMDKRLVNSRFDAIVDFSGIAAFIDTPVKHYSSGMYVRLAFSVLAFLDADILLFDEVLAVGDMQFRLKIFERIKEITRLGAVVIMASHDMWQINQLCNRCIWLHKGKMLADGTPNAVTEKYIESYWLEAMGYAPDAQVSGNMVNPLTIRTWPEAEQPGNAVLRLSRAQIMVEGLPQSVPIYMNTGFYFEIAYTKLQSGFPTNFYLTVFHISGNPALSTVNQLEAIDSETGSYVLRCYFPPNLFNHGLYYIDLWAGESTMQYLLHFPKVVFFQVLCLPELELSVSRDVHAHIRPIFEWQWKRD
ncbi:hypothetical protein C7N43_05235 [Sphingobacteriales bacterium UPWRP_1]|nr:hypothetical protein BVG80_09725 [Sphingobacteriales bacterium TSM_CSM]PSJ78106.1 hypothetical protein C7N43_05235 [Sphingobacteriales bacterium UPWRP_1]